MELMLNKVLPEIEREGIHNAKELRCNTSVRLEWRNKQETDM